MNHYTISDIAKMANVSPATVSRVLTDSPGVNPTTRQIIKDIIKEIGYQPSTIARSLAHGKTNVVALMIDDIRNPYYSELAFEIQTALQEKGLFTVMINQENHVKRDVGFFQLAKQFGFAGLMMTMVLLENDDLLRELEMINCPKVMLNRIVDGFQGDIVLHDSFQDGYMATKHLIEIGHSRIAMLIGPKASSSSMLRFDGFKKAMNVYSLPVEEENILQGDLRLETGYRAGIEFISRPEERPSAIVVGNDLMAIGFLDACNEKGVKVPEELSVVSFDDISFARLKALNLTTIHQPITQTGQTAVELLLDQIKTPRREFKRVIMETTLVVRGTTTPPVMK